MAWERHVAKEFPPPNWYPSPADFTRSDKWLPGITLVMAQVLKKYQKLTVQVVTKVVGDFIIKKWNRQRICCWQENVLLDTSQQNRMGRSQPSGMPEQDSIHNNFKRHWHVDWILSSMYEVRNHKLDFDQQEKSEGERWWMTGPHTMHALAL